MTGLWALWWPSTDMWVRGWGWIWARRAYHSHGTTEGCLPTHLRSSSVLIFCFFLSVFDIIVTYCDSRAYEGQVLLELRQEDFLPCCDTKRQKAATHGSPSPGVYGRLTVGRFWVCSCWKTDTIQYNYSLHAHTVVKSMTFWGNRTRFHGIPAASDTASHVQSAEGGHMPC